MIRSTEHENLSRDPVGRAIRVLQWMAESDEKTFGVREMASSLDMPPSAISRVLVQLERNAMVEQDEDSGRFKLSIEIARIAQLASRKFDVVQIARPHLERLAAVTEESTFLALYDSRRGEMVRVDSVPSIHPLRYVVELNRWTEIYRGASGLGILAFLPQAEQNAIIEFASANRAGYEDWLEPSLLIEHLHTIRSRGYALTRGRRIPGAVGLSVPFLDSRERVLGSVILTIPEVRFHESDEARLAQLVMEASGQITTQLGGHMPESQSVDPVSVKTPSELGT